MDESFESLSPYPGLPFPAGQDLPPPPDSSAPPTPPARPARRWLGVALGGGAVLLAAGAFLLGHATAPRSSTAASTAATLNALTSAPTATTNGSCASPRRITAGTLKSVNGTTLTVTGPKGAAITVKTTSGTKITQVVKGSLGDVTMGATVLVQGTTGSPSATGATIAASHVDIAASATRKPPMGGRAFGAARAGSGLAIGTVQSVSSSGFTVTSGSSSITVTTSSSTVFVKTVTGTVGSLTVGQPIAVGGTPNSDGSITALTIEQSDSALGRFPAFGAFPGVFGPGGFGGPAAPGKFGPFGQGGRRFGGFGASSPVATPPAATPPATAPPTTVP